MADRADFDSADVAAAILGLDPIEPHKVDPNAVVGPVVPHVAPHVAPGARRGRATGWVLLILLVAAVSIAVSLAAQLSSEPAARTDPPACGGLYTECCEGWDDGREPCVDQCNSTDNRQVDDREGRDLGLFDAEATFADRPLPPNC